MTGGRAGKFALGVGIAVYAVWASLWGLGSHPLIDPDEPRYAQAAVEMAASGDYLVPTVSGEVRLNKPPLFYWLEVAAGKALGGQSEAASRLPSAVAGLVIAFVVFLLARDMYGLTAGALSIPIIMSMPLFAGVTHIATTDATMSAFVTAALWAWWKMQREHCMRCWGIVSWGLVAFAFMAKGPVALCLYVTVAAVYTIWGREWRLLKATFRPWGVALFFAVILPWPVMVMLTRSDAASLWYRETVERFVSGVDHGGNFLLPVGIVVAGSGSWIFALGLGSVRKIGRTITGARDDTRTRFLVSWAVGMTAFFCVSKTQLPTYLMPVLPAVAVGVAGILSKYWEREDAPAGPAARVAAVGAAGAAAAVVYAVWQGIVPWENVFQWGWPLLLMTMSVIFALAKGKMRQGVSVMVVTTALAVGFATTAVFAYVSSRRSLVPLASEWSGVFDEAEQVYFLGNLNSNLSIVYYSGRQFEGIDTRGECVAKLGGEETAAVVMSAELYWKYIDDETLPERATLAGRYKVGDREYALVTNFTVEGALERGLAGQE